MNSIASKFLSLTAFARRANYHIPCAGRGIFLTITHLIMHIETRLVQYLKAEIGLKESVNARKSFAELISPKLDHQILYFRTVSVNLRKELHERIDELIPDSQLYADLYERH
tara:strand:- start:5225 stop:5560 length:336 start_codon:yes stop_codon:yes gene_type:complete